MTGAQKINTNVSPRAVIVVDYTHVGRRTSGIERLTVELFNKATLAPLEVRIYDASNSRLAIVMAQQVGLPLYAIRHSSTLYLFPGFPPSPYFSCQRDRSILFVHDLFLLTRRADLNRAAKYYSAPLFYIAIKQFRYFLTNSENTAKQVRNYCGTGATVLPCRPHIANVFDLRMEDRAERPDNPAILRVVSIGTIEPRKNFVAAAKICKSLSRRLGRVVELHIIGRFGWGRDVDSLRSQPNVVLHGFVDAARARSIIEASDFLLCTSHDEGLCLPLIEVQYSGMLVVAPDRGIFREVVGSSGILLDSAEPDLAADQIADALTTPSWRARYTVASAANIARWNGIADLDRSIVTSFLSELASRTG